MSYKSYMCLAEDLFRGFYSQHDWLRRPECELKGPHLSGGIISCRIPSYPVLSALSFSNQLLLFMKWFNSGWITIEKWNHTPFNLFRKKLGSWTPISFCKRTVVPEKCKYFYILLLEVCGIYCQLPALPSQGRRAGELWGSLLWGHNPTHEGPTFKP